MKAVMYGGGNIGRGFIGPVFRQSGYEVTFVDVAEELVARLNARRAYPVRILSNSGHEDMMVSGVRAVQGNDAAAVAECIAQADIMATAVGVNVLKLIVPNLVAGIRRRFEVTDRPLNIIICENLLDADSILAGMIKEHLSAEECTLFDERIGLVEASIGRMVPVQTEAMKDGDPLRVCVERYGWLPVDKDAFKGGVPDIRGLVPYSPFGFYIKRKLFVHNLGHSTCAYLGLYTGREYIWQAVDDPDILVMVKNAMLESAQALAMEYNAPLQQLVPHIDDLLLRFRNRALGDTCARVGGDPVRKLSPSDRLAGAARLCEKHGIAPRYIAVGMAAALHHYLQQAQQAQSAENAAEALRALSQVEESSALGAAVLQRYILFCAGTSTHLVRNMVENAAEQEDASVV